MTGAAFTASDIAQLLPLVRCPLYLVRSDRGAIGVCRADQGPPQLELLARLPPLFPEWLGERTFLSTHGLRFPYIAGEMATGIATAPMVIAMARAGMLGFFGAAGLPLAQVEQALTQIEGALAPSGAPWGSNLIHSPSEPALEAAVTDLYLRREVRRVSASAFMGLSANVVRYAGKGLHRGPDGRLERRFHVFAKVSRPEVARLFMSPPPEAMLRELCAHGQLTVDEATLFAQLPVAEDITVEADSGGHTDNRPLLALLPVLLALRDELSARLTYPRPLRIGAAGGLGTPGALAAAFAAGADYVMTGSINQAAVEAGTSPACKQLLAQAQLADVIMAPAADMFELGVKVQVLRRGTLFGVRASRLYEIYSNYPSIAAIPAAVREQLERDIFRASLDSVWEQTRAYWAQRDPAELLRAEREPRHQLALVCRWYLGSASRWALAGLPERRSDYQIWCGPAMGAFNRWVAGSFLEPVAQRTVVQIALNLLEGAAVVTRAQQLRSYGVPIPPSAFDFRPRPLG